MSDMKIETARAVIKAGIETHTWDTPMPEHDSDIFKGAGQLVEAALGIAAKERYTPAVKAVLFAAKIDPVYKMVCEENGVPYEHADQPSGVVAGAFDQPDAQPTEAATDGVDINLIIPDYDDLSVKAIKPLVAALKTADEVAAVKAYEGPEGRRGVLEACDSWVAPTPPPAQQQGVVITTEGQLGDVDLQQLYDTGAIGVQTASREGLAPPPKVPGDAPDLSVDLTNLSPQDLTRYASAYQQRLSRALLLASREEGRAKTCETLKHDAHSSAYSKALAQIKSGIDKPTAAALTEARQQANQEAGQDQTFKLWRDRQVSHEAEHGTLKAMAQGYEGSITVVSREQSRREKIAQS